MTFSSHSPLHCPQTALKWRCLYFCSRCRSVSHPRTPLRMIPWRRWTSWTVFCAGSRWPHHPSRPPESPGSSRRPPGWWWPAVPGGHPSHPARLERLSAHRRFEQTSQLPCAPNDLPPSDLLDRSRPWKTFSCFLWAFGDAVERRTNRGAKSR